MAQSELRLISNWREFVPQGDFDTTHWGTRGIYVLYEHRRYNNSYNSSYNVVYVGMTADSRGGIRSRLRSHSKRKKAPWSHFSAFQVWDNIREEEITELEGCS